jgi:hypothetical protein
MGWSPAYILLILTKFMLTNPYTADTATSCQEFTRQLCLLGDTFVNNAPFKVTSIAIDGEEIPVIWNTDNNAQTSWICSLLNSYGPSSRAELSLIETTKLLRVLFSSLSYTAQFLLQSCGLGSGIFLENWYLPTTLYPAQRSAQGIIDAVKVLERQAAEQGQNHLPIIIRSLTPALHTAMIDQLRHSGFLMIPTRQIWIADNIRDHSWRQRSHIKRDLSLERKYAAQTEWVAGEDFSDEDFARSLFLYNQIYRGKFPEFNPDYSLSFFKTAVATGFIKFYGLRSVIHQSDNFAGYPVTEYSTAKPPLSAFVGIVRRDNLFSTPLFGYDLSRPRKEGLYRRLMLKVSLEAERHQGCVHCSGGAGNFKALRGAQSHVEYAAVWMQHLPAYRQAIFKLLAKTIDTFITPYAAKNQL